MIAASCLNGVAISYAGLRVQQLVTATTFMVLAPMRSVPSRAKSSNTSQTIFLQGRLPPVQTLSKCHDYAFPPMQVLTNANKFIVILFGIVILNEPTTILSFIGMTLSIGGALWYARARASLLEKPRGKCDESETKPLMAVP
eukprot:scaffold322560_cov31-Tisochrysis_lutea.AAC.2